MAYLYLFIGLLIQGSLITCDVEEPLPEGTLLEAEAVPHEEPKVQEPVPIEPIEFDNNVKNDFFKMFFDSPNNYPTPALSMMSQINNGEMTPEEKVENIKTIANKIGSAVQWELANLLTYAMDCVNKDKIKHHDHSVDKQDEQGENTDHITDNEVREKRSVESPMDSTKLIMRLLKHIKCNNEFQNIAIEKMMSAQEIADKFGIEFNPDPDILTDLAVAANEQTQNLTEIMKDAFEPKNKTIEVSFVPFQDEKEKTQNVANPNAYYGYSVNKPEHANFVGPQNFVNAHDFIPEQIKRPANQHHHHYQHPHQHPQPIETQMVQPPHSHLKPHHSNPAVTPRPNFYEPPTVYTPMPEYYPQFCPEFEPISAAIIVEELTIEPEPELVAEEIEETVSSKVLVEHEEPGVATVNHVMTYTVSEKAHFRTPEIEKLPQQIQYYFYL